MKKKTYKNLKLRVAIVDNYGTQERFAAAIGIAEATLSKIVRGIRPATEDQRRVISKALKTPAEELFKEA